MEIVVLVVLAVGALAWLVDRATATPAARVVPVSARLAEARRIAEAESAYLPREPGSVEFR